LRFTLRDRPHCKSFLVRKLIQNAGFTEKFIPVSGSLLAQKIVNAHARLNESS
jgi:hypothetical protein